MRMRWTRVPLRVDFSKAVLIVLSALVALGSPGCGHRAPASVVLLPPLTDSPRRQEVGTVVLRMSDVAHSGHFQQPGVAGRGQGAKIGALLGAIVPVIAGGAVLKAGAPNITTLFFGMAALGAGVALAPVGAAAGAVVGAIAAPSREEADQSTSALESALAEMRVADTLVAEILEAGRAYPIIPPIAVSPDTAPSVSFLELESPRVSLASNDPTDWRPRLRLRLVVDAKLVRATDGEELGRWSWEHEGREARLVEWGKDDARLFREEVERVLRAVASQAVNSLFE